MGDALIWAAVIVPLTLLVVLLGALVTNGVYQVLTGLPGWWPFERILRKRRPATALDCVRQGAYQILQSFGLACIQAPGAVIAAQSAAALTGLTPSGPHAPPPLLLEILVAVGLFGPLVVGITLIIAAYSVYVRIQYVAAEPATRST